MRILTILCLLGVLFSATLSRAAEGLDLRIESGGVWFSRNDTRIPGNSGTRFDMMDLTGTGPDPYFRLYATYDFNDRHSLRLTLAPLTVDGTGRLSQDVKFENDVFTAGLATKGTYKFNTYRLTYRWTFRDNDRWRLGFGAAVLIRDADIMLEQGFKRQSRDDLGVVPLLHLYSEYQINDRASAIVDIEGAWSPMGRAIDAAFKIHYGFESGWYLETGYRSLEGGADNDDVYTFAWLHHAILSAGRRF
jgi:hypothetical protein